MLQVCLGGFEITPPVVFSLKSGSGPVYISGQHLTHGCFIYEAQSTCLVCVVILPAFFFREDYEEEVADDYEENDYEEEPKKAPSKPQTPAQNGKTPKAGTPAKTPEPKKQGRAKKPQTLLTLPEIKAKMMATVEKGVTLPKLLPKFENYMKNAFKVTDTKIIEEMWKWRQAVEEKKRSLFIV
uniref:Nucleophosmin n=1 Tax=Denticeps clupeoides TaxID=299321 RepID=A0AAY3ZZT4_9TELE